MKSRLLCPVGRSSPPAGSVEARPRAQLLCSPLPVHFGMEAFGRNRERFLVLEVHDKDCTVTVIDRDDETVHRIAMTDLN